MTEGEPSGGSAGGSLTWDDFEKALAEVLSAMPLETFLILALPSDEAGERAYVQFAHLASGPAGSEWLRAEASGSSYLPTTRPLTPEQEERLLGLAWKRPPPGGLSPNFVREWEMPAPFAEVAHLVVETLQDVYGVAAPDALRYTYARFEGSPRVETLELGLRPDEPRPKPRAKPPTRPTAAALEPLVEDGLRRLLGVERLVRDSDGDYPIPVGSALLFVRVVDGRPPVVAMYSTVLADVDESPVLFAAINDINRRMHFGRAFWVARHVVVATELPAVDISADQIAFACLQLGTLADHLDDVLHGRYGGTLMFETRSALQN